MFAFLEKYYGIGKSDDVGALLSGLSMTSNGYPLDQALWTDWQDAVDRALNDEVDVEMRLRKPRD